MPSVSCSHFPRVYNEYAAICERHGVVLRQSDNAASAVREMVEYVFANNKPPTEEEGGARAVAL